jgi:hypothetical protein
MIHQEFLIFQFHKIVIIPIVQDQDQILNYQKIKNNIKCTVINSIDNW